MVANFERSNAAKVTQIKAELETAAVSEETCVNAACGGHDLHTANAAALREAKDRITPLTTDYKVYRGRSRAVSFISETGYLRADLEAAITAGELTISSDGSFTWVTTPLPEEE